MCGAVPVKRFQMADFGLALEYLNEDFSFGPTEHKHNWYGDKNLSHLQ